MDPERQRIQEDLLGLISGDVRCDDLFLELYSSDASVYQVRPLGVVRPRNTADVAACVEFAAERQIPIHARGAGSGLAGESLGPGLILDFSRTMRRIIRTDDTTVRVQAGVVLGLLNEHLRRSGRLFGPDPATSHVTTMGSVVAIDASGSHWLRYGSARHHVKSLKVVLADGQVAELSQHAVPGRTDVSAEGQAAPSGAVERSEQSGVDSLEHSDNVNPSDSHGEEAASGAAAPTESRAVRAIASGAAALIRNSAELIAMCAPRSQVNRSGYVLDDVLSDGRIDLARLLTGSEGTLALITEATFSTEPIPQSCGVALLLFESLEQAAQSVQEIIPTGPSACDLMDRRHLNLARESDVRYELLIPGTAEAVLLVEYLGDEDEEVRQMLDKLVDRIVKKKRLAAAAHVSLDPEDVALYWQLARQYVPTLYRLRSSARPLPFVEDIAVPPEVLPDFLVRVQNVLKRCQVTASLFAHAGHGQLHIRPFLDLGDDDDVRKMRQVADELYRDVVDVRGTISGEHADGLSRTPYLAQQFGPLCDVFRELKQVFDPQGILNPGKIVPTEPTWLTDNLRPVALKDSLKTEAPAESEAVEQTGADVVSEPAGEVVSLQLNWTPAEMALAARNCNGCGACRSQLDNVRMCPIFRFGPREESSPRAKANLMRSVLTGALDPAEMGADAFKEIADLCVHCHQCRLECPANVDIPKLMVEAKGAFVLTNGLRPSDWLLSRLDSLGAAARRLHPLANWAIANRQARWVMEKLLGIAQGRKLPRVASRSFLQWASRRKLTRPTKHRGMKVVYFVDTYANYFDPQLARALVAVLEHNGVAVYVHPLQQQAGMPLIAYGALEPARRVAARNVSLLAETARHGYAILTTEPSAALCLTHEYLTLLDDDDVHAVAENTKDACEYLWQMHHDAKLQLDFKPQNLSLVYHMPCHLKALEVGAPGENLLRLVPGVRIERIERGCSGMAGTYGLKRENYRNSLRAGWGLIATLREREFHAGVTECSTCKMQMEQGVSKPTLHPIKLLALAYGLTPEVADLLSSPVEELVVT